MSVVIKGMQLPEKCCKCPVLYKHIGLCPLLGKRIVDPGKRREDCPLEAADD